MKNSSELFVTKALENRRYCFSFVEDEGIFRFFVPSNETFNSVYFEIRAKSQFELLVCAELPLIAERLHSMDDFYWFLNLLNSHLEDACFFADNEGHVYLRCSCPARSFEDVYSAIDHAAALICIYGKGFCELFFGFCTAEIAFAGCNNEGGEDLTDDDLTDDDEIQPLDPEDSLDFMKEMIRKIRDFNERS